MGGVIALADTAAPVPPAEVRVERLGRSVQGRPIGLTRIGPQDAPRKVLVVGCIHGDECAGRAIAQRLTQAAPPEGVQLLVVRNLNPDGFQRRTRGNAHGVDLNRNSSQGRRYLGPPGSLFYAGTKAWSEPESRAVRALVLRERPALTVWYHQPLRLVDVPEGGAATPARRYAKLVGLPLSPLTPRPGSLSRWQNARVRAGSSFVVELPPGPLRAAAAARHAEAVLQVAAGG
ncbi:MAG: DUF2817 domain-containing protein [Solirubrobacterales bacterium]|nr:DUF2817 domain-containing protein [Solirubrobacterales bacterium]